MVGCQGHVRILDKGVEKAEIAKCLRKPEYSKNTYPAASSVAQRGLLSAQINYHIILTV